MLLLDATKASPRRPSRSSSPKVFSIAEYGSPLEIKATLPSLRNLVSPRDRKKSAQLTPSPQSRSPFTEIGPLRLPPDSLPCASARHARSDEIYPLRSRRRHSPPQRGS